MTRLATLSAWAAIALCSFAALLWLATNFPVGA